VGKLTSYTGGKNGSGHFGLGYIKKQAASIGNTVTVGEDISGIVSEVPYLARQHPPSANSSSWVEEKTLWCKELHKDNTRVPETKLVSAFILIWSMLHSEIETLLMIHRKIEQQFGILNRRVLEANHTRTIAETLVVTFRSAITVDRAKPYTWIPCP